MVLTSGSSLIACADETSTRWKEIFENYSNPTHATPGWSRGLGAWRSWNRRRSDEPRIWGPNPSRKKKCFDRSLYAPHLDRVARRMCHFCWSPEDRDDTARGADGGWKRVCVERGERARARDPPHLSHTHSSSLPGCVISLSFLSALSLFLRRRRARSFLVGWEWRGRKWIAGRFLPRNLQLDRGFLRKRSGRGGGVCWCTMVSRSLRRGGCSVTHMGTLWPRPGFGGRPESKRIKPAAALSSSHSSPVAFQQLTAPPALSSVCEVVCVSLR